MRARMAGPRALFDPLLQLARGLDVVRQDQDLLGEEVGLRLEEPADALDDDSRLARSCASDHHERAVAVLDDGSLLVC